MELASALLQHVQRLTLHWDIAWPFRCRNQAATRRLTFTVMESSALLWLDMYSAPSLPVTLSLKKQVEVSDYLLGDLHVLPEWL